MRTDHDEIRAAGATGADDLIGWIAVAEHDRNLYAGFPGPSRQVVQVLRAPLARLPIEPIDHDGIDVLVRDSDDWRQNRRNRQLRIQSLRHCQRRVESLARCRRKISRVQNSLYALHERLSLV